VVQRGAAGNGGGAGAGAVERRGGMGKSKWTKWVQSAVDLHYRRH
jgi:hypothetical protein